jgi:hypothetical protein
LGAQINIFLYGEGVHHDTDGSFSSTNPALSSLVQRIFKVNDEVRQGTHTSNRENDVLTQALETRSTQVTLKEPILFLGN